MCLLLYAQDTVVGYRVVLAANRDESHDRPAESLHWWPDRPDIVGGRDGLAGGTWFAVRADGCFAGVLNAPGPAAAPDAPSRGELVPAVLDARDWVGACRRLEAATTDYAGFHLLAGDGSCARYITSTGPQARSLGDGVHTIDNLGLNLGRGRSASLGKGFDRLDAVSAETLFALLADETPPASAPDGDPRPPFIRDERFGTRCSTLLWIADCGRIDVIERRFDAAGRATGDTHRAWDGGRWWVSDS